MKLRRSLLVLASYALGIVLIIPLLRVGKVGIWETWRQVQNVNGIGFLKLVFLTGLHVFLSNQRWRSIDAVLRDSSDSAPSRSVAFAFTSIGVALGQVFPVQLGMAGARTIGTYVHGQALKRGMVGTLYEQSFDVLIVAFLTIASAATRIFRGGAATWLLFACAMALAVLLLTEPFVRLIQRLATLCSSSGTASERRLGPVLRRISELQRSGLFRARLTRYLVFISAIRFGVQVLMAGQSAAAIGARIPLWHLAAAMPFVILACVVAITPGALGVNELSYASALHLFGTPLAVGAQWALANRVLVAASCFAVAAFAASAVLVEKIMTQMSTMQSNKLSDDY